MTKFTETNNNEQVYQTIEDKIHIVSMLFDYDIELTEDNFIVRKLNSKKKEFERLYEYHVKTGNAGALADLESQLERYYSFYLAYPGYDGITRLWPTPNRLQ